MTKKLKELLARAEKWPEEKQKMLVEIARGIEAGEKEYNPTEDELRGIRRGLAAADKGLFATKAEVEAVLSKFRRA